MRNRPTRHRGGAVNAHGRAPVSAGVLRAVWRTITLLIDYRAARGLRTPPSVREITTVGDFATTSIVQNAIVALDREWGVVRRTPGAKRSLVLLMRYDCQTFDPEPTSNYLEVGRLGQ